MSQTATDIITHTPVINGGVVTVYTPIITGFPSVSGCSSAILRGFDGYLTAFDPNYGQSVDTTLTCLPQEVTQWWSQQSSLTATDLGPLKCPDMYTIASTSIVNSYTTFIACCPRSYTFYTTTTPNRAWQCASPVSIGQTINFYKYLFTDEEYIANSTVIKSAGSSILGVHINGFVFADSTTTTSNPSPAGATIPQTPIPTPAPTTTSLPTTSTPGVLIISTTPSSPGLTTSAKIGIGVGTSLAALGLFSILLSLFLIRRSKKRSESMRNSEQGSPMETCALKPTPELPNTEFFSGVRGGGRDSRQRISGLTEVGQGVSPKVGSTLWEEVEGDRRRGDVDIEGEGRREGEEEGVHEMGATLRVPFSDY